MVECLVKILTPCEEVSELAEFVPLLEGIEEVEMSARCSSLPELCDPGQEWHITVKPERAVLPVGLIIEKDVAQHYEVVRLGTTRVEMIPGPFPATDFLPAPDRGPARMRLCPCRPYEDIELVMRSTAKHAVPMPKARLFVSQSKR